jgi:hypothetical protein
VCKVDRTYVARQVGQDGRYTGQQTAFDRREDGHAVILLGVSWERAMSTSGATRGLFSSWSARADLEGARSVAIDRATVAALQMHMPEMAARYLDDDLPKPFERLSGRARSRRWNAAFVDRYQAALAASLTRSRSKRRLCLLSNI